MRGANGDGRSDGFTRAQVERTCGKNCNCSINGKENAGRLDREGIGAGDMWTNIHSLPLSMIFERLDLPNRLRFPAVCKSWRSESSSFPQREVGMPPWIMVTENLSSTEQEFISISSLKKYTFDMLDFASSKCLASKEGWLLLLVDDTENLTYSLFFLNPFTKERIELPLLHKFYKNEQPPLAAFTTKDAFVVMGKRFNESSFCFSVRVASIFDTTWRRMLYMCWRQLDDDSLVHLMMIGSILYCFRGDTSVLLVNIDTLSIWKDSNFATEQQEFKVGDSYFVEHQDQVLMVYLREDVIEEPFTIYKLLSGDAANEHPRWERQSTEDLDRLIYFLDYCPYSLERWNDEEKEEDYVEGITYRLYDNNCFRPAGYVMEETLPLAPKEFGSCPVINGNQGRVFGAWSCKGGSQWVRI